jgi:hypothetical protein
VVGRSISRVEGRERDMIREEDKGEAKNNGLEGETAVEVPEVFI